MRSKKAMLNIISTFLLEIIVILYGFVVPKIIISTYGSNVNGLISSITQFLAYISLLESGFGPVIKATLYKPIAQKNKEEIADILKTAEKFFKIIASFFLIYVVLLSITYPFIVKNDFNFIFTFSLILIISISTFFEYYFGMTYKLYLQAEQSTYITSIIQIITYIFTITVVIILAKFNVSVHLLKLTTSLLFVFRPIIQNLYVKKKYSINLKNAKNDYNIPQKRNALVQHIAYVIHTNTDVAVLTLFSSLKNVSIYSVYYMITNGVKTLIRSISLSVSSSFGDMMAKKETNNLSTKFSNYETLYIMMCTIIYSCTIVLIVPFVEIYTKNVIDLNYVNYYFGYLIVLGSFLFTIRTPYNDLANDAGLFKEMRKGAIIEAACNIIVSIALVKKIGLIGVAIGTIIAMSVRTIDLINIINSKILNRKRLVCYKKIIISLLEILIIFIIYKNINFNYNLNYLYWIRNSMIMFLISTSIVLFFGIVFYKQDMKFLSTIFKNILSKKTGGEK